MTRRGMPRERRRRAARSGAARGTPFDIVRAACAELVVLDLAAAERFYVDLLGLIVSERATATRCTCAAGRSGCTTRSSCARARSPGVARLALPRAQRRRPRRARRRLRGARLRDRVGRRRRTPGMGRALHVRDPFGFPLAFFHEMSQFDTQLQRFDLQHGAPIARIDHFNLHAPDVEATFALLAVARLPLHRVHLDRRRRTSASPAPGSTRKPTVHDVALTAGRGPRLHHLGFCGRRTPAGVLRACDQLAAAGHAATHRARARPPRRLERLLRLPARPVRATASSSTRATTTPAIPTTSRCAGRPRTRAAARSGAPARPTAGTTSRRSCSAPDGTPSELADADVDERDSFRTQVATLT